MNIPLIMALALSNLALQRSPKQTKLLGKQGQRLRRTSMERPTNQYRQQRSKLESTSRKLSKLSTRKILACLLPIKPSATVVGVFCYYQEPESLNRLPTAQKVTGADVVNALRASGGHQRAGTAASTKVRF